MHLRILAAVLLVACTAPATPPSNLELAIIAPSVPVIGAGEVELAVHLIGDPARAIALEVSADPQGPLCTPVLEPGGNARCTGALASGDYVLQFAVTGDDGVVVTASRALAVRPPRELDDDGDGVSEAEGDCDDTRADVSPSAPELANALDDDCDGIVDDATEAFDDDGDGVTELGGDCDDGAASVHPTATEVCNERDDDCDVSIDEDASCDDVDGDGFRASAGDCNDDDPEIHPDAHEVCNGVDDDCDFTTDENNAIGCVLYYRDADNDGRGTAASRCQCRPNLATGYDTTSTGDCDDANGDVYPGQTAYFAVPRSDGSYDYDCDGDERLLHAELASCVEAFSPGWLSAVAACGEEGVWGGAAILVPACVITPSLAVQSCR
ncbi:MAG: putative metal-binding motif-containing protein [Kofleriaceae bacterium]|nr:putative metal-binding motif-containing protein [Kofleriaceae bacterium]